MPLVRSNCRNLLLRTLSDEDFALLAGHADRVALEEGATVATRGQAIGTICFPEGGVASYSDVSEQVRTGIGMVGYEGFVEWHVLMGCERAVHDVTVAVGQGTALRVPSDVLLESSRRSASLHNLLMRFVQAFVVQLSRTAVSNLNDPVDRRLARWLLMNHDRLEGDEVELSHSEIATMLGVRRASVTDALHVLEGMRLIRAQRRHILVRDRTGLRAFAGDSYGTPEAEYARLIAPFGKGG